MSTRGRYPVHWGILNLSLLLLLEVGFTKFVVQALTWQSPQSNQCPGIFRPQSEILPTVSSSSRERGEFLFGKRRWKTCLFVESQKGGNSDVSKGRISHLANDTNLSSWTEHNPTWDQNIAALLEYNETHGTVNLPQNSKEYPNLGVWVCNLRRQKGRLTKEQIQQLDDIGFLWKESSKEKDYKKWHEMYTKLQAYKEEFGNCRVPQRYKPDPKLGVWVSRQRTYFRQERMRTDRKDMLDSIGFVWQLKAGGPGKSEIWEKKWEEKYEELIEFKEEHNHTNVPIYSPQNKNLSLWVYSQRRAKKIGTLREDRQAKLEKIGFTWDFDQIWDEAWFGHYEDLQRYYQELAHFREMKEEGSEGSKDATRPVLSISLSNWTKTQHLLHSKGELDPQRKALLDEIGFEWWK